MARLALTGVQFVVITGTNHTLAKSIQTLALHPSNSIRVLGFTNQVADYMEVSSILITKPGPGTTSEATAVHQRTGRPYVFLDGNASCFFWEKPNIEIAKRSKIGEAFTNEEELIAKVACRLLHPPQSFQLDEICKNEFSTRIVSIVDELVQTSSQATLLNEDTKEPFFSRETSRNLLSTDESKIALEGLINPLIISLDPSEQQIRSYWQTLPSWAISQVVNMLSWPWRKFKGHTA